MRLPAALVDKIARELEVPPFICEVIELHQGELDLLVAAIAALLVGAGSEPAVDVIGVPRHHAEEVVLARGARVRHRALDQMARAIELVPVAEIAPDLPGLAPLEEAVEVAVRPLRLRDARDHVVDERR